MIQFTGMMKLKRTLNQLALRESYRAIWPIILTQLLLRLFPMVDNRYVGYLGGEALYIHAIQSNCLLVGQFIGLASMIAGLIVWNRKEYLQSKRSLIKILLFLPFIISVILFVIGLTFAKTIMQAYGVQPQYLDIAQLYFIIGLVSMIIVALYGSLEGMMIGSGLQKEVTWLVAVMLICNILTDKLIIYFGFNGHISSQTIKDPLMMIGISSTLIMLLGCCWMLIRLYIKFNDTQMIPPREIIKIWWGETSMYLQRSAVPFIYAYQLSHILGLRHIWITYQFSLQLAYITCLPMLAAVQIGVKNTSKAWSNKQSHPWLLEALITGFIPTTLLLLLGGLWTHSLVLMFFNYLPMGILTFMPIYFFACWVGQLSLVFTIPVRAMKKSHLLARYLFISEFCVLLGGTQVAIMFSHPSIIDLALINVGFTFTGLCLRMYAAKQSLHTYYAEIKK